MNYKKFNKIIIDELNLKYYNFYISKEELLENITVNLLLNLLDIDNDIVIIFVEDDSHNYKKINKKDLLSYINNYYDHNTNIINNNYIKFHEKYISHPKIFNYIYLIKEKKPNIWDLSFTDLIRFIFPNKILKEEHLKNILKMYKKSVAPSPLGANLFPKRNIKVELEYRRKRRYGYWRNKKKGKRKTSLFPLWIYNIFAYSYPKTFPNEHSNVRDIFKNLHILKFFLRYLKFYRNMNSKKRLFFFNTLIVSLLSLLILLPNSSLKRRLLLFLLLCYYYLYTFKFLYFQYNQQIFQKKFLLFYKLSSLIFFSLRKVQFVTQEKDNISLRFYGLNNKNVNANFLVNYIMVKLGEYFSINEITWPIINRLKRFAFVRGFRLVVSGRLTRRQRATYMIRSFRRMPSLHIDIR